MPTTDVLRPDEQQWQLGDKLWILDQIGADLGGPRARVTFAGHHETHAASAFSASPFERAAVLTVDGVGEEASTANFHGTEGRLAMVDPVGLAAARDPSQQSRSATRGTVFAPPMRLSWPGCDRRAQRGDRAAADQT